jgi:hypothetical protein
MTFNGIQTFHPDFPRRFSNGRIGAAPAVDPSMSPPQRSAGEGMEPAGLEPATSTLPEFFL